MSGRISPQAKRVRAAVTRHLRACGIKDRVKVSTDTHILRSRGERWREYGDASTDPMRLPVNLDPKALAAECNATVYLVPTDDPARRPLFWLTSEYAKGGRVLTIGGSTARPTFSEET